MEDSNLSPDSSIGSGFRRTYSLRTSGYRSQHRLRSRSKDSSTREDTPSTPRSTVVRSRPKRQDSMSRSSSIDDNTPPSSVASVKVRGMTGNLAQEIHDEFLVCKICLDQYKTPKCLDCLHTFCEECIEQHVLSESTYKKYSDYREFTCPLCRKRTTLPVGGVKKLPDNILVSNLSEVVGRQAPSQVACCCICKQLRRVEVEAITRCIDCSRLLCDACAEAHRNTKVTSQHSVFSLEAEKDIVCKEHDEELVRFYCEKCDACICVLCTFNEHKDHDILNFGEAVSKYRDSLQQLLRRGSLTLQHYGEQRELVQRCAVHIRRVEQRIRHAAERFSADIREHEQRLIEELHRMYGKDVMAQVHRAPDMLAKMENLDKICSVAKSVVKGKDLELLLVKKDVHDKLADLSLTTVTDVPDDCIKNIQFLPGSIDLGLVRDLDCPVDPKTMTVETQTASTSQSTLTQTDAIEADIHGTSLAAEAENTENGDNRAPICPGYEQQHHSSMSVQSDAYQPAQFMQLPQSSLATHTSKQFVDIRTKDHSPLESFNVVANPLEYHASESPRPVAVPNGKEYLNQAKNAEVPEPESKCNGEKSALPVICDDNSNSSTSCSESFHDSSSDIENNSESRKEELQSPVLPALEVVKVDSTSSVDTASTSISASDASEPLPDKPLHEGASSSEEESVFEYWEEIEGNPFLAQEEDIYTYM